MSKRLSNCRPSTNREEQHSRPYNIHDVRPMTGEVWTVLLVHHGRQRLCMSDEFVPRSMCNCQLMLPPVTTTSVHCHHVKTHYCTIGTPVEACASVAIWSGRCVGLNCNVHCRQLVLFVGCVAVEVALGASSVSFFLLAPSTSSSIPSLRTHSRYIFTLLYIYANDWTQLSARSLPQNT
jgi:hypothetical protein